MKALVSRVVSFCFGLSLFAALPALAQQMAPDALIKHVTEDVLVVVRADRDIQNGNTKKAIELVETKVLPHFNFLRMTSLAVGRDWNKATPEQKKRLSDEFRTLLVRTYSNALSAYRNQTVAYKPLKFAEGDTEVVVKTEILQPGNKPVQLDYALEKQAEGWKVYDVIVGGISLVTNYRDTFRQEVSASGIDGLIQMLANKNRQLEAGKAADKK